MAQLNFRQGIIRFPSQFPFQFSSGNQTIDLVIPQEPLIYTFADGPDTNYLYEEANTVEDAWTNLPSGTYYLYFELDILTGERMFGTTTLEPVAQNFEPSSPLSGQMWFDTRAIYEQMKVYSNGSFRRVIRLVAGEVNGLSITAPPGVADAPSFVGTQVGFDDLNPLISVGKLLFDDENKTKPLKRFDIKGRGKFITTTTPIFSQFSNVSGYRIEESILEGKAVEPIAQYQCIAIRSITPYLSGGSPIINLGGNGRGIGLSKNNDSDFPCVGISLENIPTGYTHSYISKGYLSDDNFNIATPEIDFTLGTGTPIFVGADGQLTTNAPQTGSIQRVGYIVDNYTIFIDIQPIIIYGE